jgi:MSHA pilin protein MshC
MSATGEIAMRDLPGSVIGDARLRGFTLVELIVVLIIAGILSVVATAKLADRTTFEALGYFNQVQALARHAQKVAIAQRRPVFVADSAGAVAACYDAGCASPVADPAGPAAFVAAPPSGVSVAFSSGTFSFDGLGRPSPNVQHAITVSASGEPVRIVTIEAETGYVHQ